MLESGVPGTDNNDFQDKIKPRGNILYRYELENNKLIKPKILSDQEFIYKNHFGGVLRIGHDNKLYYLVGDQVQSKTQAVNLKTAPPPDGQSGILRMNLDGSPVSPGILGSAFPTNLYYAYGIRNGFGMDFDPLTGNLWDTENGADFGDEINLVLPGFNSGWRVMQGSSSHFDFKNYTGYGDKNFLKDFTTYGTNVFNSTFDPVKSLNTFNGKGQYRDPEFSWNFTVSPTAIKFLKSDKLGVQYQNDMFVGDFNLGNVYHFDLDKNRTSLLLNGSLADKVAENGNDTDYRATIFADGFNHITDIKEGPDGYLYIVSYTDGIIYRIVPKD
jgi:aldose sugar dehydrogenase